jgi:acetylornithine deacetylase/succinyl-diaminopimelate desuccinylase-like protein
VDAFRDAMRETWGVDSVDIGVGGSIPLVAGLSDLYPDAAILLTGACDPTSAMHGPNESVHLGDLRNAIEAQARALVTLGAK